MSFDAPEIQMPKEPPPPPMYGVDQKKKRPGQGRSMTPTFLGSEAVPSAPQMGNKTLLGQ